MARGPRDATSCDGGEGITGSFSFVGIRASCREFEVVVLASATDKGALLLFRAMRLAMIMSVKIRSPTTMSSPSLIGEAREAKYVRMEVMQV